MEYNEWHYEVLNKFKQFNINDISNLKINNPNMYLIILVDEWMHYCEDRHYIYDFEKWRKKYNL